MITLGADPEVFLRHRVSGNPVPSCGSFGGTKGAPVWFPTLAECGYQEDNVMLEVNVRPATNSMEFAFTMDGVMNLLRDLVHTKSDEEWELDTACSVLFPQEALVHPKARQFGCSADYNAYQQGSAFPPVTVNLLDDIEAGGSWRFAGGHIHIGYDNKNIPPFVAAAFADVFIGLSAVYWDQQGKRREFYGQPGRFRPTSYGIEYRTLSNAWMFDLNRSRSVAERAACMARYLEVTPIGVVQNTYLSIPWGDVREAIATEDRDAADYISCKCEELIGYTEGEAL